MMRAPASLVAICICGAAPCAAANGDEKPVCGGASFSLQRRLQPSSTRCFSTAAASRQNCRAATAGSDLLDLPKNRHPAIRAIANTFASLAIQLEGVQNP
jgi:hypothetical protein